MNGLRRLEASALIFIYPRIASAHGGDLAQGILLLLLGVGLLLLIALGVVIGGVVALARVAAGVQSPRSRRLAQVMGWVNGGLGAACFAGGAIAVPLSADGWKLLPLGVLPLGLGTALLLVARRKAP